MVENNNATTPDIHSGSANVRSTSRRRGPTENLDSGWNVDVQTQPEHWLRHFRPSIDGMPLRSEPSVATATL